MIDLHENRAGSFSSSRSALRLGEELKIVSWSELKPHIDVFEGSGKVRTDIFSTKYQDNETGLIDYGGNILNPSTGRWLRRDLLEERGGLNLYEFVRNDPINFFDPNGLASTSSNPTTPLPYPGYSGAPGASKLRLISLLTILPPLTPDAISARQRLSFMVRMVGAPLKVVAVVFE